MTYNYALVRFWFRKKSKRIPKLSIEFDDILSFWHLVGFVRSSETSGLFIFHVSDALFGRRRCYLEVAMWENIASSKMASDARECLRRKQWTFSYQLFLSSDDFQQNISWVYNKLFLLFVWCKRVFLWIWTKSGALTIHGPQSLWMEQQYQAHRRKIANSLVHFAQFIHALYPL